MRAFIAILLGLALALPVLGAPPARLKPGDTVAVRVAGTEEFDGEYVVMSDGAIAGVGFGRIVVGGRTLEEAKGLIVRELRRTLREPAVSVFVKQQRQEKVFVSTPGGGPGGGALDFVPGMDLRQVVAAMPAPSEPDLFEVHLFRPGATATVVGLAALLDARAARGNAALQPNDVIVIMVRPSVRVWVTGAVRQPGEYLLPVGADPYQAVARAGGLTELAEREPEVTLGVRGLDGSSTSLPVLRDPAQSPAELRSGDTVVVALPETMRVTVAGEVREPGQFVMRSNSTLAAAVARALGPTESGTLENVLVMRGGEAIQASATADAAPFPLLPGDLVVVRRNERAVVVLGEAREPGPVRLTDGRAYRLADVVAEAGGLTAQGSLVRVYLGRKGPDGRLEVRAYRLDRFLKDGTMADNPEVFAGDVVLIGQPRGVTLAAATQILSGAMLIQTLLRR
jgi:protein involved in polysaccharide export with SLBB domain